MTQPEDPNSNPSAKNRRKHPRRFVRITIKHAVGETFIYDYSNDLSEGGIFILTDKPQPKKTVLELKFSLANIDHEFHLKGEVTWVRDKSHAKPIDNEKALDQAFTDLLNMAAKAQQDDSQSHKLFDLVPQGMGIRFLNLSESEAELIRQFLDQVA